jgi:uncharacterized protein YegJ (DUF2314 family)
MIWIVTGIVMALIGGFLYWRYRRRHRYRMISLVALVREPVTFDPAVLASVAGSAWAADLGDGSSEGEDGFVVGGGVTNMIMHDGEMFVVNTFPVPYTDDPDAVADTIVDMRLCELFREHKAWFSCDVLGADGTTPEDEIRDYYRRLGKLFVELLDENCLLVFLPDLESAYAINEDTEAALRSNDPVRALQQTSTVPVIEVADDDPLMREAVKKARDGWPKFVAAYDAGAGENFSVKAPVSHGSNTEFIWISVTALEGDRIYGELGNDPADLGPLKLGSKVSVQRADLNDWCYIDPQGNMVGGFTIEAVNAASRRKRK